MNVKLTVQIVDMIRGHSILSAPGLCYTRSTRLASSTAHAAWSRVSADEGGIV